MAKIRYRSPELVLKRRRTIKKMTALFVLGFSLLLIGLVFFLRMDRFQIREVSITGTKIIDEKSIRVTVNDTLAGSCLWLIPKTNTFIYSVSSLEKKMLEDYNGILTLNIHREGFQKISIEITERKPHALWCANDFKQDISSDQEIPDCYFVDYAGLVFEKAPFFSGNVYFVYRGKLDKESPLGAHVLDKTTFANFEKFVNSVKTLNVEVVGVLLKEAGDFDLILSSNTKVMLSQNLSYDEMYNNFSSLIKSDQFATTTLDKIDYIDMRFGNKIFFKTKTIQTPVKI